MRIYSLSKVLAFPLAVIGGIILLTTFSGYSSKYSVYIFIPVALLVALYVFHGVIDYWWLERHPIPLDDRIKSWFEKNSPYYQKLNEKERIQFENRLSLYENGREFKSVGTSEHKEVPFDIKCIVSSQAIILTSGQSDFLLGDMDRIYFYKHPFPSPTHQFLHTAETHIEDGMILLCSEYALPGISHPDQFYNIAMHAYVEAYINIYPRHQYPTVNQHGWDVIEQISGHSKTKILQTLGFESVNPLIVHIVCYFDYNEQYKSLLPLEYKALSQIFKL